MARVSYSSNVKWAVVKEKLTGELTNREIMNKYGITNNSQIKTWMKWYRNNELYRFNQPVGKQYTYGYGPESKNEQVVSDCKKIYLKIENAISNKVYGNCEGVERKVVLLTVEKLRNEYTVTQILEVLEIPRSTYYRWMKEDIGSNTPIEDALIALI